MKISTKKIAEQFIMACKKYGYNIILKSESCVAISMDFTPGDKKAFNKCEASYNSILEMIPMDYKGSVWGSNGETEQALSSNMGYFIMNKTGCSRPVLTAIKKMMA